MPVQVERLRGLTLDAAWCDGVTTHQRVSEITDRLAMSGADRLEGLADAVGSLDGDLGAGHRRHKDDGKGRIECGII